MAKKVRLTTPTMALKWGAITVPDTTYNPEGDYYVKALVDPKEAKDFLESLEELVEQAKAKGKKEAKPAKKKSITLFEPYEDDYDKEGNETGLVLVKFKSKFEVPVFDSQGSKIEDTEKLDIWGGSKIKVNYTPNIYYVAGTNSCGVGLYLNAVQVIELVSGGGNAETYGFGAIEGGFEYSTGQKPTFDGENEVDFGDDEPF